MQIDLSGKKIIVTGASSGIGLAMARQLLSSGAMVAAHFNNGKSGIEELTKDFKEVSAFKADLSIESECNSLFNNVLDKFGTIDGIILNAGIFEEHPIEMLYADWINIWQKTIQINLNSVGFLTKLSLEHFKNNGGGQMIYVASRAAFRGETEENLAYAASKGGVVSLARSVARSFGKYGITSFILAPGFTKTPMAQKYFDMHGEEAFIKESALKQITLPEHISPVVNLIMAGLMDHATGSTIDFNAGSYIH